MSLPSLPALRVFEAAARHGSFTRAAEELHVTQAAVSHQVRALEEQLGLRLFERSTRRLAPTAAGRKLLPRLSHAFRLIEAAIEELRRGESVLTVTTVHSFGAVWLAPRLGRFMERHPGLEVQVRYATALADLERDGIDVAIRWGRGRWDGLKTELIGRAVVMPVAAPGYVAALGLCRREDLARATLLHEELRLDWREWLTTAGLDPALADGGPLLGDDASLLAAALAGHGVALLPLILVEDHVAAGRLVEVFDLPAAEGYGFYLAYRPGALDRPRIRAFRDFVMGEPQQPSPKPSDRPRP